MTGDLSKNLNLLMAEARINAEELSRRTGLPASTIKKIRNNQDANPTLSTIIPLAKYFALSLSEIVGEAELSKNFTKIHYQDESLRVPLITWKDTLSYFEDVKIGKETIQTDYKYSNKAFALLVEEENWENLPKDTILLVDPEIEVAHRDFIIVHKNGQQTPTLKQALFDDGDVYLKPPVFGYQLSLLTREHQIIGVVMEYKRNLKNHK